MAAVEKPSAIPPEVMAELQERAERAAKGIRDTEDMRRAAERMDWMPEEMHQGVGDVDLPLPLIRETRDED
jgi:hypothetical protein